MSEKWTIGILGAALILTLSIAWLYDSGVQSGFGPYTTTITSRSIETDPVTNQQKITETTTTEIHPSKSVWDWLGLAIIPLGLAGVAVLFNSLAKKRELDFLNKENQITMLQTYLEKMTDLILNKELRKNRARIDSSVRAVGQVLTTNAYRMLDVDKRNVVTQFIQGVNLADSLLKQADLNNTDLSETNLYKLNFENAGFLLSNLSVCNLTDANLSFADLSLATLQGTTLLDAIMNEVDLQGADLYKADLTGASLIKANLFYAKLIDATLDGADLSGANLTNATVTLEQLSKAKSLKGATMPDGSIHD